MVSQPASYKPMQECAKKQEEKRMPVNSQKDQLANPVEEDR